MQYANGQWLGYDCCGGVVAGIRSALDLDMSFNWFTEDGIANAPWVTRINGSDVRNGDLIFVDYAPVDGDYGHVMTYNKWTNPKSSSINELITTIGIDPDFKPGKQRGKTINDGPMATIDKWKENYGGVHYDYGRINWGEVYRRYGIKGL